MSWYHWRSAHTISSRARVAKSCHLFLMFRRDPIMPVAKLLEPKPRYYGERGAALKMDTLRRLYTVVVQNICKAREKIPTKEEE